MTQPPSAKWPSLLVVMRHAESEANTRREELKRTRSSQTHLDLGKRDVDIELTDLGRAQATEVGRYLGSNYPPFDSIYVSPHRRTRATAERVLDGLSTRPRQVIEERLREKEFGILEDLTRYGVQTLMPHEHARRLKVGKYYYRPPGGESYPDVNLRVHSFIGTMVREHGGGRILVVTHSVVVLCFRRLLERMEEHEVLELDRNDEVKNASLLVYEIGSRNGLDGVLVRRAWNLAPWERTTAASAVSIEGGR